jgi:GNAT superfamily N-acetyltransferase
VRLAALREAPHAFTSTFEKEAATGEENWRYRLGVWTFFIAEVEGQAGGIVGAGAGELAGSAVLISLWVDPAFRGKGVGSALVGAVVGWARSQRYGRVLLWVTEVNKPAERLYERLGFLRTGRMSEVRPGGPGVEHEMSRRLEL